jgi:hypothetical protein
LILCTYSAAQLNFCQEEKILVRAESNGFKVSFWSAVCKTFISRGRLLLIRKIKKILIPKMGFLGYLPYSPIFPLNVFPRFQLSGFSQQDSKKFAEVR